jgi:16S rRNA (guanine527-N7)-methyltransferase
MPKRRGPSHGKTSRRKPSDRDRQRRTASSKDTARLSEVALLRDLVTKLPGVADSAGLTLEITEYLSELRAWNARGNLVSQSDLSRLVSRHVSESLAALPWIDRSHASQIIDLGSGGGFPIVPLKLARPDLRVALVESRRMKSLFLRRVAERLSLQKLWVWNMRAESLAELPRLAASATLEDAAASANDEIPTTRPSVDLVTARAVASLADLAGWAERLVRPGGRLLAFKGSRVGDEIGEWKRAPGSWSLEETIPAGPGIQIVLLQRS